MFPDYNLLLNMNPSSTIHGVCSFTGTVPPRASRPLNVILTCGNCKEASVLIRPADASHYIDGNQTANFRCFACGGRTKYAPDPILALVNYHKRETRRLLLCEAARNAGRDVLREEVGPNSIVPSRLPPIHAEILDYESDDEY